MRGVPIRRRHRIEPTCLAEFASMRETIALAVMQHVGMRTVV